MFAIRVLLPGERGHEFLLVLLRLPFLALLLSIPGLSSYKPNKDYGETELEKLDELKQQVDPRRGSEAIQLLQRVVVPGSVAWMRWA